MFKISCRAIYKVVNNIEHTKFIMKLPQKSFYSFRNCIRSVSTVVHSKLPLPPNLLTRFYPKGKYFPKSFSFVVTIDRITYVVYRGTEVTNYLDILTDLYATKVHPFGKGNGIVHNGFFHRSRIDFGISINAKEDKIDEGSILDLIGKSESDKLIFTGHSLGGAAAELSFLRYITFCENFPSNPASRFKDKSSYIVYAAPINTSIEISKRFEKYSNQMHSIDQYNDPIVDIVRDLERMFSLRDSEDADDDYTGLLPFNVDDYFDEVFKSSKYEMLDIIRKSMSEKEEEMKKNNEIKQISQKRVNNNKFVRYIYRVIEYFRKLFHFNERKRKRRNEEYINNLVALCDDLSSGLLDVTKTMNEMKEKFSKVATEYKLDELFSSDNNKNEKVSKENDKSNVKKNEEKIVKKILYEDDYLNSFGESIKRVMINTVNDINDLLNKANDIFLINTHNNNLKEINGSTVDNSKGYDLEESFKKYLITTMMMYRNEFEKSINKYFKFQKDESKEKLEERTTNYIDELIESINLILNYLYLTIKSLDLSPEFIVKAIDAIQQTIQKTNFSISTLIPVYEPISLPLGIHHIIMKDGKLISTTDSDEICNVYIKHRSDADPVIHKMRYYASFINDLNYNK